MNGYTVSWVGEGVDQDKRIKIDKKNLVRVNSREPLVIGRDGVIENTKEQER